MADTVITSAFLQKLETLLGEAHDILVEKTGNIEKPKTLLQKINAAKLTIRGGHDADFGVKGSGTPPSITITALPTATSVYVPTTTLYFGGAEKILSGVTLSCVDSSVNRTLGYYSGYYLYANDRSTVGGQQIDTFILPTLGSGYALPCFGTVGAIPTLTQIYPKNYKPSLADSTVLLAKVVVTPTGVNQDSIYYDETNFTFYEGCNDDDLITQVFPGLNTVEDNLLAVNRGSEFTTVVTSLKSHVKANTGHEFTAYWRDQGYSFTDKFRKLYSEASTDEIIISACSVTGPTAGYTVMETYKPAYFEAVLNTTLPAGTGNGLTLTAYAFKSSTYETSLKYGATVTGSSTMAMYVKDSIVTWPTTGYLAVKGNYGLQVHQEVPWVIASYDRSSSPTIIVATKVTGNNAEFDPWSTRVRLVDQQSVYFTPASTPGTAGALSTSTQYLGVARAYINGAPGSTYGVSIRSK